MSAPIPPPVDPIGLPPISPAIPPPKASQPTNPVVATTPTNDSVTRLNKVCHSLAGKFPTSAVTCRIDITTKAVEYSVYLSGHKHPIHPDKVITSTSLTEVELVVDGVINGAKPS